MPVMLKLMLMPASDADACDAADADAGELAADARFWW